MNKRMWLDYTKIREELDFSTVLEHYEIPFKAGTNQIKIHCPFHEDKTPSLSIDTEGKKFNCFGCPAKGNALEFVLLQEGGEKGNKEDLYNAATHALKIMHLDSKDFFKENAGAGGSKSTAKALKRKASASSGKSASKPVSGDSGDAPASSEEQSGQKSAVPAEVKENPLLELKLQLDTEHEFLKNRGLTPEMCEEFELGYCARGIMKHRIAIPIHNLNGDRVAYSGRYAEEDVPDDVIRYKVPKEFHKSLEIFNLHRAKVFQKKHLVLIEGYWGTFRLHQAGIPTAALMGTSVSPEQVELIKKAGFRFVTLILDGDNAGKEATPEAVNILSHGVYVRVLELPEGVKPDTMSDDIIKSLR